VSRRELALPSYATWAGGSRKPSSSATFCAIAAHVPSEGSNVSNSMSRHSASGAILRTASRTLRRSRGPSKISTAKMSRSPRSLTVWNSCLTPASLARSFRIVMRPLGPAGTRTSATSMSSRSSSTRCHSRRAGSVRRGALAPAAFGFGPRRSFQGLSWRRSSPAFSAPSAPIAMWRLEKNSSVRSTWHGEAKSYLNRKSAFKRPGRVSGYTRAV
jgi:hypothetical protein